MSIFKSIWAKVLAEKNISEEQGERILTAFSTMDKTTLGELLNTYGAEVLKHLIPYALRLTKFDATALEEVLTEVVNTESSPELSEVEEVSDVDECRAITTEVLAPTQKLTPGTYTRKTTGWVGLHAHSHFSFLDGFRSPTELVERVAELGQPAIALTDHGGMWGVVELMQAASKKGVTPIAGNEMYLKDEEASARLKAYSGNGDYRVKERYHQLVLAISRKGYENLTRLTSDSYLKNSVVVRKKVYPLITKEELAANKEGLVLTSGCLAGLVCQGILSGDLEFAKSTAKWYKEQFGDNYYIEIQDHGLDDDQRKVNHHLVAIASELNIGLVVTADSHYVKPEQKEAHKHFLRINKGEKFSNVYEGKFWHPSESELKERLSYLPQWAVEQAIDNTVLIAQKVEAYSLAREPVSPNFQLPDGWNNADEYLEYLAWEGLAERFPQGYIEEYKLRLTDELRVLKLKQLANYFLIVQDYVAFARKQLIPTGLGRGSAAGSLVAYSLKITGVDPIENGLVFSRFINEERKSYPDIDLDFCIERRHEVVEYIKRKYGYDNVANIITFNKLESKSALKDAGWVLGVSFDNQNYYSKMLPVIRGRNVKIAEVISDSVISPEFYNAYTQDVTVQGKDYGNLVSFKKWVDLALDLEKTIKTSGVHAAGVVIGDIPLDSFVPLQKNQDGTICTQYNMKELELLGLQKMDILGLNNLTMLDKSLRFIGKNYYHLENIDFKDSKVFKSLHSGETEGIFQFESGIAPHIIKGIAPDNLEDISAANTLNRPGCLDLTIDGVRGVHEEYIARKFGRKKTVFAHENLKPILGETYGLALYQEQNLRFCSDIAGWSLGKADVCRAAIGKKKLDLMASLEQEFKQGVLASGYSEELADELWTTIDASKNYSFNKAHSYCYGVIAYMCAWVKYYYPSQFFAALMSGKNDLEKTAQYSGLLKRYNLKLLLPDINLSNEDFTPINTGILYGLSCIQGLGDGAVEKILGAREKGAFTSLTDFMTRVAVSSAVTETLIKAGAFDSINPNRASLIASVPVIAKWASDRRNFTKKEQTTLAIPGITWGHCLTTPKLVECKDLTLKDKLQYEKEVLGLSLSGHPLDEFLLEAEYLGDLHEGQRLDGVVLVVDSRPHTTKNGKPMGFATVEDSEGNKLSLTIFGANWQCFGHLFQSGEAVHINAKCQTYNNKINAIVEGASRATFERVGA